MRINKPHIQKILTETVLTLCQTGIPFDAELSVEGLLGITLDKDNIILVNIKEVIRHDVPQDYSKKSEKRKADAVSDRTIKRQKEGASKRGHSFIPEGYHSPEDSQSNGNMSLNGNGMGANSLKIPLIPPEFVRDVQAASQLAQMRQKQVTDIRQKHSEMSRMLAVANMQAAAAAERPKSASSDVMRSSPPPEMIQLPEAAHAKNENRPQSAINLEQEYISPRPASQGNSSMRPTEPIGFEHIFNRPQNTRSPMFPTDLSMHNPPQRPYPSPVFPGPEPIAHSMISPSFGQQNIISSMAPTSQPIGVVLDTNVQPPAPLAVVAGTGVIQPMASMQQQQNHPDYDFLKDLPEGTAIVQPVEIVPEVDIRTLKSPMGGNMSGKKKVKKERHQASPSSLNANKADKMGRPKKSKEFCRFRCTICNAASSRKFNLQRHVNSHHPNTANCIIDLTPPKNPRQMRPKGSPGDVKFHIPEGALFGMGTPEGVTIDSAMDLSVSPSSEHMMFPGYERCDDTASNHSSRYDEFTPPQSASSLADTEFSIPVLDMSRATPPSVSPQPNTAQIPTPVMHGKNDTTTATITSADVKKRFAKGKKSLDNMLFNKFGMYHNFSNADKNATPTEAENVPKESTSTTEKPQADCSSQQIDDTDDEVNALMELDANDEGEEKAIIGLGEHDDASEDEEDALFIETDDKLEDTDTEKDTSDVALVIGTVDQNASGARPSGSTPIFESQHSGSTATMELEDQEHELGNDVVNNDSENKPTEELSAATSDDTNKQTSERPDVLDQANDQKNKCDDSEMNIDSEIKPTEGKAHSDSLELDIPSATTTKDDSNKRRSGASDSSIETDANANNKSDMSFKQSAVSPADVNGNSKSTKAIDNLTMQANVDCDTSYELSSTSNASDTAKTIDSKTLLENDNVENENVQKDDTDRVCENTEYLPSMQETDTDAKTSIKSPSAKENTKDTVRLTRRSQSNVPNIDENIDIKDSAIPKVASTISSPRKPQQVKAAIREPIKTRTATRTSSITTRRSSARDENEMK